MAILYFVQSGNFEILFQAGIEPGTLRVTVGPLIHYTKFPYEIFFKFFKPNVKIFLQSESPVGSSSNRRFRLKRQKTRKAYIFLPRPNFFIKFSEMYRKVQNLIFLL